MCAVCMDAFRLEGYMNSLKPSMLQTGAGYPCESFLPMTILSHESSLEQVIILWECLMNS
jgi:hypothetical protein